MIRIKIGKRTFSGVYHWDDMSLDRFCRLAALKMPPQYEAFILADGKYDHDSQESVDYFIDVVSKLTDREINEDFPNYYTEVVQVLTNIPGRIISRLDKEKVIDLYDYYFKPFVLSLIYHTPVIHFMGQIKEYEPPDMGHIRIGWNRFLLPAMVTIMDQEIPLAKEPIISYTEASDIFRGMKVSKDDIRRLALFMAIYCRKRGETYDEARVLKRQHLFMKAPMSAVWSVFFYTSRRMPDALMTIQLYGGLPRRIREVADQVRDYRNTEAVV